MPVSEAHKRANKKYQTEKVDDLRIRVPKGQRDLIQAHAKQQGESVNSFVWRAIQTVMQMDNDAKDSFSE